MASKEASVLKTYADIAEATFEDSLITAKKLQKAMIRCFGKVTKQEIKLFKML